MECIILNKIGILDFWEYEGGLCQPQLKEVSVVIILCKITCNDMSYSSQVKIMILGNH